MSRAVLFLNSGKSLRGEIPPSPDAGGRVPVCWHRAVCFIPSAAGKMCGSRDEKLRENTVELEFFLNQPHPPHVFFG